jgi:hypothetical protein
MLGKAATWLSATKLGLLVLAILLAAIGAVFVVAAYRMAITAPG